MQSASIASASNALLVFTAAGIATFVGLVTAENALVEFWKMLPPRLKLHTAGPAPPQIHPSGLSVVCEATVSGQAPSFQPASVRLSISARLPQQDGQVLLTIRSQDSALDLVDVSAAGCILQYLRMIACC
ncbi:hypothetical protein WJX84_000895 [Apatococcus fuscideae]|uniref:Uncharacterized protein n=1 Tax=Apatococcus fuscideae TaxID=2026836 RepID=A0AAW1RFW9_9CHLO